MDGDAAHGGGEEGEAGQQGSVYQQDVSEDSFVLRGARLFSRRELTEAYRFLRGDSVILVLLS